MLSIASPESVAWVTLVLIKSETFLLLWPLAPCHCSVGKKIRLSHFVLELGKAGKGETCFLS